MAEETIFIVYSNSTTLWGQLAYGIRRMSATVAGTPCPALELTHGGLGSSERPEWVQAKKEIPVHLKQQHYDEIPSDLKHYIEVNKYEFPCVVGRTTDGRFHMLFADSELPDVVHNPTKFVNALRKRAVDAGMAWK
ncbi:hypothetical protein B0A52_05897 [Exophiala mesophila]|uniref:Uncharacterized protein n=1 Tax=Exophiala mesophila TaxID=212818 RepID=A0A438N447_EXOME|nr:hypothetical protein B0A52_05897 [Exophiala mesophila]